MAEHSPDEHCMDTPDACDSCALGKSRREFLRDGFAAAFGALLTLGASEKAAAASVSIVNALAAAGSTVTYAIPAANGAQIDRDHEVIVARWENNIYAFSLSCPHQHTALRWEQQNARFQCPKHHSKYQPDGTFISGRATRSMDRFSIKRQGNSVVVDTSVMHKEPDDPKAWREAVVELGAS
jgi:nitrite reductase/ring-hydroxylating ferredoxin subunit